MDYTPYYKARNIVTDILSKDLLGPVFPDEVIVGDRPTDYYIMGKVSPKDTTVGEENTSISEEGGAVDEESGISLSNSKNPSSFGISFCLSEKAKTVTISCEAAKYVQITKEEALHEPRIMADQIEKAEHIWKRAPIDIEPTVIEVDSLEPGKSIKCGLSDNIKLSVLLHKIYEDGSKTITCTMINETPHQKDIISTCEATLFQPKISVTSDSHSAFVDVRRNKHLTVNEEVAELDMLYSRVDNYASGHGCAVDWDYDSFGVVNCVRTEFFPRYELFQMKPSACFKGDVLQMHYIAKAPKNDVISGLIDLTAAYDEWIRNKEKEAVNMGIHNTAAKKNIEKCRETYDTLLKSIKALDDHVVYDAFAYANEAMFLQRKQMLMNTGKYTKDEDIKWYPFQLAFFLQEIISFSDPDSPHREKVDLLWFPTGGGKTEAYLGIAAFYLFLRRLRYGDKGRGVSVLMRYTLRLLTFQQFERAAAMICACEVLREEASIKGGEFSIGLWAGEDLTPNYVERAEKILAGETDDKLKGNPRQLKKCPWCGYDLPEDAYSCDVDAVHMTVRCANPQCHFHRKAGLPIYLIDDDIYVHTPSYVIATVDKFAQLAMNEKTYSLFGKTYGYMPPELIIQDELHLISGPLGTVTGLYEGAIRKLCTQNNGTVPKIVASTATIRNAKEQIRALYASGYTQFPPQGIDINDSFFAEISKKEDKPSRLYMGCLGVGTSPITVMLRVMTAMMYAGRYLAEQGFDDKVVDSFWTITGYYNSLRELGGAIIRVIDDIQDRWGFLYQTKFRSLYPIKREFRRYDNLKELTSRAKSEDIGEIIQKDLQEQYKSDGSTHPLDYLLSSNMISVGVDVGRLGTMVVVGQPKTTSEYIQATSRVGRETPGLVVTTYSQTKSRDRSHYETFKQYHSMFYRFVEATSVTPFSDRARDRALQALYVILCRSSVPELSSEDGAGNFDRNNPKIQQIKSYIINYIDTVDPKEHCRALKDLESIEAEWENKIPANRKMSYRRKKYHPEVAFLFDPDYMEESRFRMMNSMRSVETAVKIRVPDGMEVMKYATET